MPTQPGSLPSNVSTEETIRPTDSERAAVPFKQKWETPALEMIALDETETGPVFATAELTTFCAQPLPS